MAVRISLEGSLRTTVTALGLTILVAASLLVPVIHSAPLSVQENEEKPWWHNPCSNHVNKIRHSRGIPPTIKNQLKTFVHAFNNKVSHHIQHYCSKLENNLQSKQIKKPNWLPAKKFYQSLGDNISALPELHYQIQVHAATLHKLSNMHIESKVNTLGETERGNMIKESGENMKLLLCEVETAMNISRLQRKGLVPFDYVSDVQIPAKANFTTGMVTHCTLLKELGNFLRKTNKKITGKNKRKKAGRSKKAGGKGKAGKANRNKKRTSKRS